MNLSDTLFLIRAQINITFAGRNESKFASIEKELTRTGQQSVKFKKCDIDEPATIAPAIEGACVLFRRRIYTLSLQQKTKDADSRAIPH